jgi:peptidoglycan hydrolase CwlO-like protein
MSDFIKDLIARVTNLSDAVLSEDGIVARNHENVMTVLKTIADSQLRLEAKVNELVGDHEQTKAKLVLLERPKSNGASP